MRKLDEWCLPRQATTFAVVVNSAAVGTISLSHRRAADRTARIGYWIGSRHRGQGICKRAFALALAQAESEGIASVSATIASGNRASRRIWEHHGAVGSEASPGRTRYEIKIGRRPAGADGKKQRQGEEV